MPADTPDTAPAHLRELLDAATRPENAKFYRELLKAAQAAPQKGWRWTRFTRPDGSPIETVEHVAETTSYSATWSPAAELWGVTFHGDDAVVCYTGNGPNSEAHARFLAYLMPQNVIVMLERIGQQDEAISALAARVIELQRALYMAAASNQGGHSDAGAEIARLLNVPFPLRMDALAKAAMRDGFDPDELWPWLKLMRARSALEDRT